MSWSLNEIEHYFEDRILELKTLAARGDPWVFLCASGFIEYLAKMRYGEDRKQKGYRNFLRRWFFKVCPAYSAFNYGNGRRDLHVQMYHVLRCGLVHSFSLIADPVARIKKGRDRSILLAHRSANEKHLQRLVDRSKGINAAIFVAEDFVEDIEKVTRALFDEAKTGTARGNRLKRNIERWFNAYPPIGMQMF